MDRPEEITDAEFTKIRDLMYAQSGVYLRETKKPLVIARLRPRLYSLGLKNFGEYLRVLNDPGGDEMEFLVNAITTNESNFFRYPQQFMILTDKILPVLEYNKSRRGDKFLRIWSAGCATGEEPYSLAMALREFFAKDRAWQFQILASDINSEVLRQARQGRYPTRSLRELPADLQMKYGRTWIDPEGCEPPAWQVIPEIQQMVRFQRHNLLEPFFDRHQMDMVFFRNVMIYFDQDSKQRIVDQLARVVVPGGYLFVSLAEHLHGIRSPFCYLEGGVYQRLADDAPAAG